MDPIDSIDPFNTGSQLSKPYSFANPMKAISNKALISAIVYLFTLKPIFNDSYH